MFVRQSMHVYHVHLLWPLILNAATFSTKIGAKRHAERKSNEDSQVTKHCWARHALHEIGILIALWRVLESQTVTLTNNGNSLDSPDFSRISMWIEHLFPHPISFFVMFHSVGIHIFPKTHFAAIWLLLRKSSTRIRRTPYGRVNYGKIRKCQRKCF